MPGEPSAIGAALRALDWIFTERLNRGDVAGLVEAYYAVDTDVLPPNAPPVRGRGQIRELWRELLDDGIVDVRRHTARVTVDGRLGYGVGEYTHTIRRPGRGPFGDTIKFVLVYQLQHAGVWKVAVDIFSSDLPDR
jgi:ketosteroid isomerase-like protein